MMSPLLDRYGDFVFLLFDAFCASALALSLYFLTCRFLRWWGRP